MELGIKNKVALVTGASAGIGAAILESLAKEGAQVVGVSRTVPPQNQYDKGLDVRWLSHDLSSREGVSQLLSELISLDLSPDIVVHNLGGALGKTDVLLDPDEFWEVLQFNLGSAIGINHGLLPEMLTRGWGRVVHVSSIASLENQGLPAYGAAKAALNAYVRSVSRFTAKNNVIMNTVLPGAILTSGGYWEIAQKERPQHVEKYLQDRMAIGRFGDASEVANLVVFLCSELSSFMVGSSIMVDGGQGRVFHDGAS